MRTRLGPGQTGPMVGRGGRDLGWDQGRRDRRLDRDMWDSICGDQVVYEGLTGPGQTERRLTDRVVRDRRVGLGQTGPGQTGRTGPESRAGTKGTGDATGADEIGDGTGKDGIGGGTPNIWDRG